MNATTEKSYGWTVLENLPKGTTLYTVLRHVSGSGMARWITVFRVEDGEIRRVPVPESHYWLKTSQHNADYRVNGAGMDMGFELVYSLGMQIHNDGYYFRHEWL